MDNQILLLADQNDCTLLVFSVEFLCIYGNYRNTGITILEIFPSARTWYDLWWPHVLLFLIFSNNFFKESAWSEPICAPLHTDGLEPAQHLGCRLCCGLLKNASEKKEVCNLWRKHIDLGWEIGYDIGIDQDIKYYVSSVIFLGSGVR